MSKTHHHGASKYRPEHAYPRKPIMARSTKQYPHLVGVPQGDDWRARAKPMAARDILELKAPDRELALRELIAWVEAVPEDPEMARQARAGVDFLREERCHDVSAKALAVAVKDGVTLVRMSDGIALIRVRETNGARLVFFDVVDVERNVRATFWYNAHSVANVGAALRKLPREPMRAIFEAAL